MRISDWSSDVCSSDLVRNTGDGTRRLSATGYVEWILGDLHACTQMHVVTSTEPEHPDGAVLARNAYNAEFGGRVAFFDAALDAADWPGEDARRTRRGTRVGVIGPTGTLPAAAAPPAGPPGETP